jgi:hypothetical protein
LACGSTKGSNDAGLTEQGVADLRGHGWEHVVAFRDPDA